MVLFATWNPVMEIITIAIAILVVSSHLHLHLLWLKNGVLVGCFKIGCHILCITHCLSS
jgi:predicted signal transduction protein with EAL and GGDEF domain